jgi:hypothetical protein
VLAYEHDGLADEAANAQAECAEATAKLRRLYEGERTLGAEAAEIEFAYCVRDARRWFAEDLQHEQDGGEFFIEWRGKRGQRRWFL